MNQATTLTHSGFLKGGCPIACGRVTRIPDGPFAGEGEGPEHETVYASGSDCGVDDLAALTKANYECKELGLDTISMGSTIACAMELYEEGILKESKTGMPIRWGDGEVLVNLVRLTARREGFGENLEMGAFPKSARGRLKETMTHVVELFPILEERRDQPAGTLSGGEQQMLAISRALMSRPRLLLVDELSLGLAPMITKTIYRTLSALGDGLTILLVEQNVEQALHFSQRAHILESGRLTRTGDSADLMADAGIRRAYLGV